MERILIIEDEKLASDKLSMLVQKIRPAAQIVNVLTTVEDSLKWLSVNEADLIFMDINLSDDISFKIFERFDVETPIIFTTAYDQYAIKAFEQNSLDYILKPVSEEDLTKSFAKYDKFHLSAKVSDKLKQLIDTYSPANTYKSRVLITYGGKSRSIDMNMVAYAYAFEKGTYITINDGSNFLADDTLDDLERSTDPSKFYRLSRKFLVNISAIREIHRYSNRRLKVDLYPVPKFEALVPT
ncbi:MAG: LytTR family DNA-binding domain-containing protein, partial [Bacteroidota bacterium]